jgi:hypothetical protein
MDSSAVWKRPTIRSMNALTVNSANGVLRYDAAVVMIMTDPAENPTKEGDDLEKGIP